MSTDAVTPSDRFALVGSVLENKFRVDRPIAEGGFGVVYAGWHLALDTPVAVKVLKIPADLPAAARGEFIDKFVQEAKVIARIRHPSIVQVLDTGVSPMPTRELAPWMVLEYLTGDTLTNALRSRPYRAGRTAVETLALLRPAFEGLAYAHDEGIAHRDVKPSNMILVPTKRGLSLRLLDFGIAKTMADGEAAGTGHTRTQTANASFSPKYAAPEQVSNARTGPWTDVHALGLIFTEVLTDCWPYGGKDITELYQDVLGIVRPTPRKVGCNAGPLEAVLARAVAFRPEDRYPNAGEFLAALEAAVPLVGPLGRAAADPPGSAQALGEYSASSGVNTGRPAQRMASGSVSVPANMGGPGMAGTAHGWSLTPAIQTPAALAARAEPTGTGVPTPATIPHETTMQSSAVSHDVRRGGAAGASGSRRPAYAALGLGAVALVVGVAIVAPGLRAHRPAVASGTVGATDTAPVVPAVPSRSLGAAVPATTLAVTPVVASPVAPSQPAVVASPALPLAARTLAFAVAALPSAQRPSPPVATPPRPVVTAVQTLTPPPPVVVAVLRQSPPPPPSPVVEPSRPPARPIVSTVEHHPLTSHDGATAGPATAPPPQHHREPPPSGDGTAPPPSGSYVIQ